MTGCGQVGDPPLGRSQPGAADDGDPPGPGSAGEKFVPGLGGDRTVAEYVGKGQSLAQRLAGCVLTAGPTQRGTQRHQGAGVLKSCR